MLLDINFVSPTNCHRSNDMSTKVLDKAEKREGMHEKEVVAEEE